MLNRVNIRLALLAATFTARLAQAAPAPEPPRFVVFYGADAPIAAFSPYQLAVLDGERHPPLAPMKAAGIKVFGYISLGEVEKTRSHFGDAQRAGILLHSNPDWPDARYIDLRQHAWQHLLLDEIIPPLLAQGFDGLFLDTLDDAGTLEHASAKRYSGMIDAGAALVRAIHERFPTTPLMLNRAYEVGVRVAPVLDSILAESLTTTYDFRSHRYHMRSAAELTWGLERIADVRHENPKIRVFTLDYWDPSDRPGISRLYAQERRAGFVPYVATIDLQRIVAEPSIEGRP